MADAEKKQALDGRRANMFYMSPAALTIIGVDTDDGAAHPLWRKPGAEADIAEIEASMRAVGQIEPVVVRKDGDGTPVVVEGRTRTLAGRRIDGFEIAVILIRSDEATAATIAAAANHVRRVESAIVLADDAARLSRLGKSPAEIAPSLGLTGEAGVRKVRELLKLADVSTPVRKAVMDGEMSASAAAALSGLKRADQVEALEKIRAEGTAPAAGGKPKKAKATVARVKAEAARQSGKAPSAEAAKPLTQAQMMRARDALRTMPVQDGEVRHHIAGALVGISIAIGLKAGPVPTTGTAGAIAKIIADAAGVTL